MNVGAYVPGVNPEFDLAVQARPRIVEFLRQGSAEAVALETTERQLAELVNWIEQADKRLKSKQR